MLICEQNIQWRQIAKTPHKKCNDISHDTNNNKFFQSFKCFERLNNAWSIVRWKYFWQMAKLYPLRKLLYCTFIFSAQSWKLQWRAKVFLGFKSLTHVFLYDYEYKAHWKNGCLEFILLFSMRYFFLRLHRWRV